MPTLGFQIIEALSDSKNVVEDDLGTLLALDVSIDLADGMLKASPERVYDLLDVLEANAGRAETPSESAGYVRAQKVVREAANI